jgi:hypothetical protein
MNPRRQYGGNQAPYPPCGPGNEVGEQHLRVEDFVTVKRQRKPDAQHMRHDKYRNCQAEEQLQQLHCLPSELPALIQRPDAEGGMHETRGVEHDCHREKLPEPGMQLHPIGHRVQRDIAERMIEEMAQHIGEQDHAADEPDLPDANATKQFRELLLR